MRACAAQMELAGRSLKGQLKQAERLGARFFAQVGRRVGATSRHACRHQETLDREALVDRLVAA